MPVTIPTDGYINGSDLLLMVDGKCIGHCTSHTLTFNSETKDRAVKPVKTKPIFSGKWKGKGVTGLSISISAEGLRHYGETEGLLDDFGAIWAQGESVVVKAFKRGTNGGGDEDECYLIGKFIITSLEETSPAEDDATYSIQLENDGAPTSLFEVTADPGE